jgi:hypothetical protein
MVRLLLTGLVALSVLRAAILAQPLRVKEPPSKEAKGSDPPPQGVPKDKGKDAPPDAGGKPKPPPPTPGKPLAGVFKTKDLERQTLTITNSGKDHTFKVTKDTKFLGPRGARSDDRLKDDRLDKGYRVTVVPDVKDDGTALEVKIASRAEREKQ